MEDLGDKSPSQETPNKSKEELKSNVPNAVKGHFHAILAAKEKPPNSEDLDKPSDDDAYFEGFDEFFGDDSSDSQTESESETTKINGKESDSETDTASEIFAMEDIERNVETNSFHDEMTIGELRSRSKQDNTNTGQQSRFEEKWESSPEVENLVIIEEKSSGFENPKFKAFEVNIYDVLGSPRPNSDREESYQETDSGELLAV